MKKYLLWASLVIILILDWLALDDITTRNEPNYAGEWGILAASIVIIPFLVFLISKKK
ncbi:hypothetical protein ACFL58_01635 [Elusimicrobiota bacterium]